MKNNVKVFSFTFLVFIICSTPPFQKFLQKITPYLQEFVLIIYPQKFFLISIFISLLGFTFMFSLITKHFRG